MPTIGTYRLHEVLGRCNVGSVWSAFDAGGIPLTIAVLDEAAARDDRWRSAFAIAARALGRSRSDGLPLVAVDFTGPVPWVACRPEAGPGPAQIFVALGVPFTGLLDSRKWPPAVVPPPRATTTPVAEQAPVQPGTSTGRWVALAILLALVPALAAVVYALA